MLDEFGDAHDDEGEEASLAECFRADSTRANTSESALRFPTLSTNRGGKMLNGFFRRRAIRSYLRQLLYLLRRDHGVNNAEEPYTAVQIMDTLRQHGLNVRFECYAVAMFVGEEAYEETRKQQGWTSDYAQLRNEIASISNECAIRSNTKTTHSIYYMGDSGSSAQACHGHSGHDCGHSG
jgi:hypothetical protein